MTTDDNRSHRLPGAQLLLGPSRKLSNSWEGLSTGRRDAVPVRCPMKPVGCTPWCSTDAVVVVAVVSALFFLGFVNRRFQD